MTTHWPSIAHVNEYDVFPHPETITVCEKKHCTIQIHLALNPCTLQWHSSSTVDIGAFQTRGFHHSALPDIVSEQYGAREMAISVALHDAKRIIKKHRDTHNLGKLCDQALLAIHQAKQQDLFNDYPANRFNSKRQNTAPQTAHTDRTQYINLGECDSATRMQVVEKLEQHRPAQIAQWRDDKFIERMQKTFGANIMQPLRKKHMIVLYGAPTALQIERIKKHFDCERAVINWNGIDEIDDAERTLIITNQRPPYPQPYNALSLGAALQVVDGKQEKIA